MESLITDQDVDQMKEILKGRLLKPGERYGILLQIELINAVNKQNDLLTSIDKKLALSAAVKEEPKKVTTERAPLKA